MHTKEHLNNQGVVSTSQGLDPEVRTTRQVAEAQSQSSRPPGQAGDQVSTLEAPELGQEEGGWVDHHRSDMRCHDPTPIFHFPPPPQVFPTTPSPPVTQPARAQQTPVQRQSPASIPLLPSPPPMDICPPSPPCPTLAHVIP